MIYNTEKAKMKKEMEEEIRAQLAANMENMMSWDEKVVIQSVILFKN